MPRFFCIISCRVIVPKCVFLQLFLQIFAAYIDIMYRESYNIIMNASKIASFFASWKLNLHN